MTAPTPRLGLVVPLYDEEERIADYGKPLLDHVTDRPGGAELVFVDDGSTDGTVAAVEELLRAHPAAPARLVRRPHHGKGAAVAAGLAELTAAYGAFCDVDLSTPLAELDRVVEAAVRASVLAIASRDLTGSHLAQPEGRVRESLGKAYNRVLQVTVTPGVVDTQCGAKAAAMPLWRILLPHCRERGFAWDAEVVAVALAVGVPVHEVAVEWRHDRRSKVRVGRDGVRMLAAVPRITASARRARAAAPAAPAEAARSAGEVFDDANAAALAAVDRHHWWFRSKAALVATAIRRTGPPDPGTGWLVDVGGGAGGVTALLGWRPDRVVVAEGNRELCRAARSRHGLAAARASVDQVPVAGGAVQVACLLDVIEHVADPVAALAEAGRLLAPGGRLVVNVPAHRWLWSAADEELGHHRRYTRSSLRRELAAAGFEPVLLGHVFSWLVAPVWWRRRLRSGGTAELGLDVASPAVDRAAMALTWAERMLVGRLPLPFGTSILCVARRAP